MPQVFQRSVQLAADRLLEGVLTIPEGTSGIVIIAHGGSSLFSERHLRVADTLHQKGVATLMLELLTRQDELIEGWGADPRRGLDLLVSRLLLARGWLQHDAELRYLPIGYFGSGIGAVAALVASARQPQRITAIVSCAGQLELVRDVLSQVRAPTLLIVGSEDVDNLLIHREALDALSGPKSLHLVPHASSHFEEPGTLDDVARLAGDWFARYFRDATQMKYGWTDEQGRWV